MFKKFGRKKSGSSEDKSTNGVGTNAGPGAMSISGGNTVFRVTVPDNVSPGEEFQVYAGSRIVRVRCPPDSRPGQSLQITVPVDPTGAPAAPPQQQASPGAARGGGGGAPPPLPPDSPNVRKINDPNDRGGAAAYMVTIPEGVRGGQQFPVTIQGQQLMVTCPQNARPGMSVRIVPPPPPEGTDLTRGPQGPMGGNRAGAPKPKDDKTQLFEVEVPPGVMPGQPFALLAGGVRVLVTCPSNASPGQRIRFKLPLAITQKPKATNEAALIKLSYDKDGWQRTIRVSDMKFQWVRVDNKGDIDTNTRFDVHRSAYVRKLEFRPGDDPRIRTGILTLVPASDAVVDSKIKSADNRDLVTYSDIANAQVKLFEEKAQWFQDTCAQLCVEWNEGHMRMNVRRQFLLGDSVDAVMSLSRKDLRKLWRFEFIGEMGIDAGGLAREWFQLVTEEIFDPDMGLWQSSAANQMCMEINPASGTCTTVYAIVCVCLYVATLHSNLTQSYPRASQNIAVRITWCTIASWAVLWVRLSLIDNWWLGTWYSISTNTFWAGLSTLVTWRWLTRSITVTCYNWRPWPRQEKILRCFVWISPRHKKSWEPRKRLSSSRMVPTLKLPTITSQNTWRHVSSTECWIE
jgi:hypothetical protein